MEQKDIAGYEGLYAVTTDGRVWSYPGKNGRRSRFLLPYLDTRGYDTVSLHRDGQRKIMSVHRLVALTFIPLIEGKPHVNHMDGNKSNNTVENLEWVTLLENLQHARALGLYNVKR